MYVSLSTSNPEERVRQNEDALIVAPTRVEQSLGLVSVLDPQRGEQLEQGDENGVLCPIASHLRDRWF
jgi:hypothetical protein